MSTIKIKRMELEELQRKANEVAIRENSALGLTYRKVKGKYLVEVSGGKMVRLHKPEFGMVPVKKGKYQLKNK